MADYPSQLHTQRTIENLPGIIYDSQKPRTLFAEDITHANDEIIAIETELGINPKAEFESVAQFLQYCKNSIDDLGDSILYQINEAKEALFPIGSIYTNASNSANPATLLGFGTWAAFAAGRVIVGKDTSGTFATNGATGGAETHSLTKDQQANMRVYGGDKWNMTTGGSNPGYVFNPAGANNGTHETTAVGGGVTGQPHNNLQPYIVVYMWKRTA